MSVLVLLLLCVLCCGIVQSYTTYELLEDELLVEDLHNQTARALREVNEASREKKVVRFKQDRMEKVVNYVENYNFPIQLSLADWSVKHNSTGNAIFAIALIKTLMARDASNFVGTLRRSGYTGDIVIAVLPDMRPDFLTKAKEFGAITYVVPVNCKKGTNDVTCRFEGQNEQSSINMLRYHIYQYWSIQYSEESIILLSDFSDVFFQADPIAYRLSDWHPNNQLVVYQEAFPNMVINRCRFNSAWIRNCYGEEALTKVGSNTVSCSGQTMGTRNGILVYTYLMTKQMNPKIRYGKKYEGTNPQCTSVGMDQGFHNWLIYSGILNNYMNVKIYQQGEGSVNTVGGFFGKNKALQFSLEEWKIMRGNAPFKGIYNWNGDLSPAIHQIDRFLATEQLAGGYKQHFAVFQGWTQNG